MKLNLKRKAPQEQTKVKRPAMFAESSDSEADEQSTIEAKAAKIDREINSQVLDEDIRNMLHQETRKEQPQEQKRTTSKYLENLLASTNERKQEYLQVKTELAKKSGALIFETGTSSTSQLDTTTKSDEPPKEPPGSTKPKGTETSKETNSTKFVPRPSLSETLIKDLIRSKLTAEELMNYKNRYWQRHPERAKLRT